MHLDFDPRPIGIERKELSGKPKQPITETDFAFVEPYLEAFRGLLTTSITLRVCENDEEFWR
jgi:hypothetical protein